jgi:hypothetical protein
MMKRVVIFLVLALVGLSCFASCNRLAPQPARFEPTESPQVIATAWTALLFGELEREGSCIRVKDRDSATSYLLIWPPDTAYSIEGDTLRAVTGRVTGKTQEVLLQIGERVRLGGGETDHLEAGVPEECPGPYWVVFEIGPHAP